MPYRVKLSELTGMTGKELRTEAAALARAQARARAEGSPALDARIRRFETRYEMTSEEMRRRFARGELPDTAEIMEWRILLAARDPSRVNGGR